jgi:hypothetical protein
LQALRRAGRFDYVRYPVVAPSADDEDEALQVKWKQWVEHESYKRSFSLVKQLLSAADVHRLVYHLFEHDMQMAMVKHRPPLITYAELTLAIPASKTLWLAPTAELWKSRYFEMNITASSPSLRELLRDEAIVLYLRSDTDAQVARSTYLHGIAAQIWEHSQQSVLLHETSDPSSQLCTITPAKAVSHTVHMTFAANIRPKISISKT